MMDSSPDESSRPSGARRPATVKGLRRIVYSVAAAFFLVLGLLGVLLPGLPTTPFLLLTSYFLVRISPRLNEALLRSGIVGPILVDWQHHGVVRRDIKIKAISVVVLAVGLTVYLSHANVWITSSTLVLALIGICVIVRLPS